MVDIIAALRKAFTAKPESVQGDNEATTAVLDAVTAAAATEALIASADSSHRNHEFDPSAASFNTANFEADFATALGQSSSGLRARVFVGSADLVRCQQLLTLSVERHTPLVIHGIGHRGVYTNADSGCFMLLAATPQEAVDFTLIARRMAEHALVPGLVICPAETATQAVQLPSKRFIRAWLGSAADQIPVPTPAQRLIFGATRRRVPRWHNGDRPILMGAHQDNLSQATRQASQHVFFNHHLQDVLSAGCADFGGRSGRHYSGVMGHRLDDAELVLVIAGAGVAAAEAAADRLRRDHHLKVGVVGLRWLRPFPQRALLQMLQKKAAAIVLEPVDSSTTAEPPLLRELRANLNRAQENHRSGSTILSDLAGLFSKALPRLHSVGYDLGGLPLHKHELVALGLQLARHNQVSRYLGVGFTDPNSAYPKRQAASANLGRLYPEIAMLGLRIPAADSMPKLLPSTSEPPSIVRRLRLTEPVYDSLPRFWDQVGVLYRDHNQDQLSADPCLALPLLPPLSAALGDPSATRAHVPAYDPQRCDGCGHCWRVCPDGAIAAVAMDTRTLVQNAIEGGNAGALQPLAQSMSQEMETAAKAPPARLGDLLTGAFTAVAQQLPATRRNKLEAVLATAVEQVGELPIAVSERLYKRPEARQPHTGLWLSLAIDPDACKGCGLCSHHCPTGALDAVPQTPEWLEQTRHTWAHWNRWPDTLGASIEGLAYDPGYGPLPALLLSRHCAQTMAGGDGAEPGSGEKLALRYLLAISEYLQQPRINAFLQDISATATKLRHAVQQRLAQALPDDSDAAALDGLLSQVQQQGAQPLLQQAQRLYGESPGLRQWLEQAEALQALAETLRTGPQGLGRARANIALMTGSVSRWAASWPYNPFQVPVTLDGGAGGADFARGLLQGQQQPLRQGLALLRQARRLLDKPAQAAPLLEDDDGLDWTGLTSEEQRLCPPLWLIGDDSALQQQGVSGILRLLGTDTPVKVLICTEIDWHSQDATVDNLGLLALAQRRGYVAQTSVSDPDHCFASFRAALDFPGPALLRIYTPSPERHGFASTQTLDQAALAVASRAFPLFRYDPRQGQSFGLCLDLSGNPDATLDWSEDASGQPLTPAHWALPQQRYAEQFQPLEPSPHPTAIPMAAYLSLETTARTGKTPVVTTSTGSYTPNPALLAAVEECHQNWRRLQEWAGLRSPFTQQIEAQATARVAAAHQAELAALVTRHENQLRALRQTLEQEMAGRIRHNLLRLAGYPSQAHSQGTRANPNGNPLQPSPAPIASRGRNLS